MALQGNLRDFSATEILQLIGSQKKTGCLLLEWKAERALIYVQEGLIVSSRKPGMTKDDPLLAFLLKIHRLSDEQLHGIRTIQRESKRDLEDLLINGRYLDREELAGYTERQILDDLMRITRWDDGDYRFDPNNCWPNSPLVQMTIEGAIIEAARRVDEQVRFLTAFRDPYQVMGLRDLPDPDEELYEEVRELFGIIDGRHTIAEIIEIASLSEYETYEALYQMFTAKWIEIVGRRQPGKLEPSVGAKSGDDFVHRSFSLIRELALAALVGGATIGLHTLSGTLSHDAVADPGNDVFVAAGMHQLELSLDLYALEKGHYPQQLQDLVDDHWVSAGHLAVPGHLLRYRQQEGGQSYSLDLQQKS